MLLRNLLSMMDSSRAKISKFWCRIWTQNTELRFCLRQLGAFNTSFWWVLITLKNSSKLFLSFWRLFKKGAGISQTSLLCSKKFWFVYATIPSMRKMELKRFAWVERCKSLLISWHLSVKNSLISLWFCLIIV